MSDSELLLLDQINQRLYVIPLGALGAVAISAGYVECDESIRPYLALPSAELLYADHSAVAPYAVRDADLSIVLKRFEVYGLQRTGLPNTVAAYAEQVPWYGNLTDPTWLSIQLGGQCDSRCSFCYSEWIRHQPKLESRLARIALEAAASMPTVKAVVFTGGEPTLRGDLPDLVTHAAALGFRTIGLQTNGHRLADPGYLARIDASGVTEILLSLHGSRSLTHDRIARHQGSYSLAYRALTALGRRYDITTEVNFVVCPDNMDEAEDLVHLVHAAAPKASIRYSFPIIEGAAFDNIEASTPTLEAYLSAVTNAKRAASKLGVWVSATNAPACISDAIGLPANYLLPKRRSMLGVSPFVSTSTPRGELAAKVDACESCSLALDCVGLQLAYLRKYPMAPQHVRPVHKTA